MDQIIKTLSQNLGLPEAAVKAGVGVLLNLLKQKAGGTQFESLVALLPGAGALMSAPAPATESGAGGLLGGLLSKAGGLLGGDLGGAAAALGALEGAGIPADKAGAFAGGFIEQAQKIAGPDAVNAVVSQIPALASFLGKQG